MDPKWHIWTLGTYNSNTDWKLRKRVQIKIRLGFWVKNTAFSTQESDMFFWDPKRHIWAWLPLDSNKEQKVRTDMRWNLEQK